MKPRFSNRRTDNFADHARKSSTQNAANSSANREKAAHETDVFGALALTSLALAALCALPPLLFKIAMIRRDLAMRNRMIPLGAPLSPDARLLILAPHPDDETLATGGLIARARHLGIAVRVVFLTNGDGSGSTKIGETLRRGKAQNYQQLAKMRQREATNALGELGISPDDIVFLGFPDGGTGAMWKTNWRDETPHRSKFTGADRVLYENAPTPNAPFSGKSAVREIARVIENFRPTRVVTTDGNDTHADHRAAFCFLLAALEYLKAKSSTRSWAAEIEFHTVLIHHAIWPLPHGFRPDDVLAPPAVLGEIGANWFETPLDLATRAAKKGALSRYESQMTWTPNYLRGFLRRNELFAIAPETVEISSRNLANENSNTRNHAQEISPDSSSQNARSQDEVSRAEITENQAQSDASSTRNDEDPVENSSFSPILRDPRADSLLRQSFPCADIRALSVSKIDAKTLRVEIATHAAISPKIVYALSIHALGDVLENSEKFAIEASFVDGNWRAILQRDDENSETQTISSRAIKGGIEFDLPLDFVNRNGKNNIFLLSSSTRFGGKILDETSTISLRI